MIDRAIAAGAKAICLTVDVASHIDPKRQPRGGLVTPAWVKYPMHPPKAEDTLAKLDWPYLDRLRARVRVPIVLKGILHPADAGAAADAGITAVVVSNHGGRTLDGAVTTAEILPEIADAVGDRVELLVDGGIRRGVDVIRALALGARAVLVGRPFLWGLAIAGEAGQRARFGRSATRSSRTSGIAAWPTSRRCRATSSGSAAWVSDAHHGHQGRHAVDRPALVRIQTDEGSSALSEVGWQDPAIFRGHLDRVIRPQLIGANPLEPARIWERLVHGTRELPYPTTTAFAGVIDIALWDIIGKDAGLPIHALLAGRRSHGHPALLERGCRVREDARPDGRGRPARARPGVPGVQDPDGLGPDRARRAELAAAPASGRLRARALVIAFRVTVTSHARNGGPSGSGSQRSMA